MPASDNTVAEVRRLAAIQVGLAAAFLLVVFVLLDGLDSDPPAIWLIVLTLVLVVVGAVLAERAWRHIEPLSPELEDPHPAALAAYVAHTQRKFLFCEAPLLLAVLLAFVSGTAGWLVAIAGVPGLAVLAFESWPSLRSVSLAEASLEAAGASSGLVDAFVDA